MHESLFCFGILNSVQDLSCVGYSEGRGLWGMIDLGGEIWACIWDEWTLVLGRGEG